MSPNWHILPVSFNTNQRFTVEYSDTLLVAIGGKQNNSPHLEFKQRWVNQYNFYLNDQQWGPMFVRMCPYFPFSARVCLNQHHLLAPRMQQAGIFCRQ